ncbi:hypothetical protein BH10PSE15_BH10PSE15_08660 [soil metagenome]
MPEPEDEIEAEIGGVQGSDDDAAKKAPDRDTDQASGGETVIAPDAGEIEWAGGLVKKAPGTPQP